MTPDSSLETGGDAALVVFDRDLQVGVVAFRPTVTAGGWLSNFNADTIVGRFGERSCRLHQGFSRSYYREQSGKVQSTVTDGLKKMLSVRVPSKIWFVGHSRAGAIASIAVLNIATSAKLYGLSAITPSMLGIITTGQPRVGDSAFAEIMEDTIADRVRVRNNVDIVPTVPPKTSETAAILKIVRWLIPTIGNYDYEHWGPVMHLVDADQLVIRWVPKCWWIFCVPWRTETRSRLRRQYVCNPRDGEDDTCNQLAVSTLANTVDRPYDTPETKFMADHFHYWRAA